MRPTVLPGGSCSSPHWCGGPLSRVAPWHETSSRGTAGHNRSGRGDRVGLHLSWSAGRPVRVEVARVDTQREVVFRADAVEAGEHETPDDAASKGCRWPVAVGRWTSSRPGARATTRSSWRSTSARRCGATTRSSSSVHSPGTRLVLALATNTWHAYNDFGGPNLYTGGTTSPCSGRWRPATCTSRRARGGASPGPARPIRRMPRTWATSRSTSLGLRRSAGWPDWELPFLQWANARASRSACAPMPTWRSTRGAAGSEPVSLRRARRVLVTRHARHGGGVYRRRRECGVLLGQHVVVAGAPGGGRARRHGRVQGLLQERSAAGDGSRAGGDHVLVRCRRRPAREPHDGSLVHPRGLSPHRSQRDGRAGRLHGAPGRPLDLRRHRARVRRRAGRSATVVGYECDGCVFTYRDGLPYPTGEDGTPPSFEILGTCPTQHFTRETAPRPPKPGEPSELEYIASRIFGTRDPEGIERIRTATRCSVRTRTRRERR